MNTSHQCLVSVAVIMMMMTGVFTYKAQFLYTRHRTKMPVPYPTPHQKRR